MKVLLINPPRFNEVLADNPSFIDEERGFNPPLGILYVGTYLKKNSHHQVAALDAQVEGLNYDDNFRKMIREADPDIVGITAMTFTLIDVVKTIDLVKEVNKKIVIVLGGPHPTIFPEETLNLPCVDYVIIGEGEMPFLGLVNALNGEPGFRLRDIKGLVYKENGRIFNNGMGEFIDDLDELPPPERTLLPVEKYNSILGGGRVVTTMFTSRGCPFQCAFCDRPHLGKKFRARSAKRVVDEMAECLRLGIGEILVYDDTFTVNRERVSDICREIIKRNLRFIWDIRARVDTVDEDMLKLLKQSGCHRIHFGVESGTDRILKILNKGVTVAQITKTFALCKKLGIETLAYFMIGSPTETKQDIYETMKFARKIDPDYAHITILTPYPGTKIYESALREGVIKSDYWREFANDPEKGVVTRYWENELSKEELFMLLGKFYREFYGRPSYILGRLAKVRSLKDFIKKAKTGFKVLYG